MRHLERLLTNLVIASSVNMVFFILFADAFNHVDNLLVIIAGLDLISGLFLTWIREE